MSIKSITIENFKGIREAVKFDLAPITLLYGPNSAGKSTLLQALAYLNDVINRDECNNEYTRTGGESMKLGGFMNIVNGHDSRRTIKFSIELDSLLLNCDLPHESDWGHHHIDKDHFPYLQGNVKDGITVEISISWDTSNKNSYVSEYMIGTKEGYILAIKARAFNGPSTIQINFDHPHFLMTNSRHVVIPNPNEDFGWKTLFDVILHENSLLFDNVAEPMPFRETGAIEHPYYFEPSMGLVMPNYMRPYQSAFKRINDRSNRLQDEHPETSPLFRAKFLGDPSETEVAEYNKFIGTEIGKKVNDELDELKKMVSEIPKRNKHINSFFFAYFNSLLAGSLQSVSYFLKDIAYIGPLRKKPTIAEIKNDPNLQSWHDGMAAWANIFHNANKYSPDLLSELNMYLDGNEYFNTGYNVKIGNVLTLEMEIGGELQRLLDNGGDIDLDALRIQLQDNSRFAKLLKLHDIKRGVDVDVSDVGTGISQILPIIVALIIDDLDVIMVEQPELHIHPRLQVQMGELLVHSLFSKGKHNERQKLHLLETHSKDLLLRLMRRIREPSADGYQLKPSDLAVYYIDEVDGSTRIVRRIDIDSDGDFIDEWPGGFFEESYFEKFSGR